MKLTDSTITNLVTCVGSGCPTYSLSNEACPSGNCISECDIDYWVNGVTCVACDASCGGNCVRASTDTSCTLCDNLLCDTCYYFKTGNDARCQTCITNAATTSPSSCTASSSVTCSPSSYDTTCACIDTTQTSGGPTECTCATECSKCTALDKYSC